MPSGGSTETRFPVAGAVKPTAFGDLITFHMGDLQEVGRPGRRFKAGSSGTTEPRSWQRQAALDRFSITRKRSSRLNGLER
jgi:hypothetical protein